jgi:hypothetical protein
VIFHIRLLRRPITEKTRQKNMDILKQKWWLSYNIIWISMWLTWNDIHILHGLKWIVIDTGIPFLATRQDGWEGFRTLPNWSTKGIQDIGLMDQKWPEISRNDIHRVCRTKKPGVPGTTDYMSLGVPNSDPHPLCSFYGWDDPNSLTNLGWRPQFSGAVGDSTLLHRSEIGSTHCFTRESGGSRNFMEFKVPKIDS